MAFYFQRVWNTGRLIISGELGSKLIVLGIYGALPKSKGKNKAKTSILFDL